MESERASKKERKNGNLIHETKQVYKYVCTERWYFEKQIITRFHCVLFHRRHTIKCRARCECIIESKRIEWNGRFDIFELIGRRERARKCTNDKMKFVQSLFGHCFTFVIFLAKSRNGVVVIGMAGRLSETVNDGLVGALWPKYEHFDSQKSQLAICQQHRRHRPKCKSSVCVSVCTQHICRK